VIVVGEMSLWVGLLMAGWAATVSFLGGVTGRAELIASGERGIHAVFVLLAVASTGLWAALLTRDFSVAHVALHTSANLPSLYTISAFWAGRGGSLLLWALILAGCSVIAIYVNRRTNRELMPYATAGLAIVQLLLLASLLLVESPFTRLDWLPPEGRGMSPQLQSPGMALYVPVLYVGYAATTVPFAFALAALLARRLTPELLGQIRRWALVAWLFTAAGMLIGMRSVYLDPDRPGHWLLHPVESAALLPWLVITGVLISLAVQEERRVVRKWHIILVISSFLLTIFATFSPAEGTISGVRPLARVPGGIWVVAMFAAAIVIVGVFTIDRVPDLGLATRDTGRMRQRLGAWLAAMGALMLSVAVAAQLFSTEHRVTMQAGEATELTDPYGGKWRFVGEGVSRYLILNRRVTAVTVAAYRGGVPAGLLITERRQHVDSRGAPTYASSTEAGLIGTLPEDVQAVLGAVLAEDAIAVRISFNPLMWLLWPGAVVAVLGGMVALWPRREAVIAVTPDAGRVE
jgi:cytochrome c biogenesis factor